MYLKDVLQADVARALEIACSSFYVLQISICNKYLDKTTHGLLEREQAIDPGYRFSVSAAGKSFHSTFRDDCDRQLFTSAQVLMLHVDDQDVAELCT